MAYHSVVVPAPGLTGGRATPGLFMGNPFVVQLHEAAHRDFPHAALP